MTPVKTIRLGLGFKKSRFLLVNSIVWHFSAGSGIASLENLFFNFLIKMYNIITGQSHVHATKTQL